MNWIRVCFCLFFVGACLGVIQEETFRRRLDQLSAYEVTNPIHLGSDRIYTSFQIPHQGQTYTLKLVKSDLVSSKFVHKYYQYDSKGNLISVKEEKNRDGLDCFYRGIVEGVENSWAAISTCNGLQGEFAAHGKHLAIEPHIVKNNKRSSTADHIIYEVKDIKTSPKRCGLDHDISEPQVKADNTLTLSSGDLQARLNNLAKRGGTHKYVEVLVVNDKRRHDQFGTDTQTHALSLMNTVNQRYVSNNFDPPVSVHVVNMATFTENDPWTATRNGADEAVSSSLLNFFRDWTTNNGATEDNSVLLTGDDLNENVLGLAFVGTMCSSDSNNINEARDDQPDSLIIGTISHEMGHNFKMEHDGDENVCSPTGNIMASSSSPTPPTTFSQCSKDYYDSYLSVEYIPDMCLENEPTVVFGGSICGDGIIGSNETCDCGPFPTIDCTSCCDTATCLLHANASCSNEGCCENCQLRSLGVSCRSTAGTCDVQDTCDGVNAACPDIFQPAGTQCTYNAIGGLCWRGTCYTYDRACKAISITLSACPASDRDIHNNGIDCGLLVCREGSGGCVAFEDTYVPNGVPCTTSSPALQCLDRSCVNSDAMDGNCDPNTCAEQGAECGTIDNGCGNANDNCGDACELGKVCSSRECKTARELLDCFIATAAYESSMHPHVWKLRVFRDRYLHGNVVGELFISYYYTYSPAVAQWIAQNEWARSITRILLWPVVQVVQTFFL